MWKASQQLRRYWHSHWGLIAGILTGLVLAGAEAAAPHVGDDCAALGEVVREWRVGLPGRPIMCVATTQGQLVYAPVILPENPSRQAQLDRAF